jgi:hypothetical protein
VHELPLDDEDVRRFLSTIGIDVWHKNDKWQATEITSPDTFYANLKYRRGNDDKTYDPFYMIHEIKLAYSDKDVDRRIRQIASYFEALLFFCRDYEIQNESDEKYENRLIAEMVENGLISDDDALSGNAEELAEYYKDDFVTLMTDEKMEEGNDGLDYFIFNFGEEETMKMVIDNNLIDIFKASRDAVKTDGVAHFLSHYDGETLYLSDGYVAYRIN